MEYVRWGLIELPAALRVTNPNPPDLNERFGGLNCEKGVIDLYGIKRAALIAEINDCRHCGWYEPNADLSFAEHTRARHSRQEFQRRLWLDRVVFTVVGAMLAFALSVLTRFLPF